MAAVQDELEQRERSENFPVALRVLPAAIRTDLHAVYAVARTIDETGDAFPGDRVARLTDYRADLLEVWRTGRPQRPELRRLVPTVRAHRLTAEPFELLVQANLVDQRVLRYATFDQLRGYCRCSADPIGRIVLAVFDQADPTTAALSDRVCTALQLLEHWQDVAQDRRAGRIYLPQADLDAYGVRESDLDEPVAAPAVRALMHYEIDRAVTLLDSGAPIVGRLHGWARVAVAGYVAGGWAAAAALRRTGGDVLGVPASPRRVDVLTSMARLLAGRAGAGHQREVHGG